MKSNFLTSVFLLLTISVLAANPKVIQIKMPASVTRLHFSYRDNNFKELLVMFTNSSGKDTLITQHVAVQVGQVLSRLEYVSNNGKATMINQTFIVPVADTVRFEVDNDKRLVHSDKPKFFVEDLLELDREMPMSRNISYMSDPNGLSVIQSIYLKNQKMITDKFDEGILTSDEKLILNIIAKSDYYFRNFSWAQQNNRLEEIVNQAKLLQADRNDIQKVNSPFLTQLFAAYVGYIQRYNKLQGKEVNSRVTAILNLGWNKNITFAFLSYVLSDIESTPDSFSKTYNTLKNFLNGEYTEDLEKLKRKMLPRLENLDQIKLVTPTGIQTTLATILNKHPDSYFLIDFWASWCVPCREEAPFFEKAKVKYANNNLIFLSFSTDTDKETENWKKALTDDKLLKASNHYKLVGSKSNSLFSNFELQSIPRYILIDNKGEFINLDFPKPSTPEVHLRLEKIILKLRK